MWPSPGSRLPTSGGLKRRGQRHMIEILRRPSAAIDESYNANPASMGGTLKSLGEEPEVTRRVAVLGPMRELGEHSAQLHAGLAPGAAQRPCRPTHPNRDEMRPLAEKVIGNISLDLVASVDEATEALRCIVRPGDAVLVKASNSVGLAKLVESMQEVSMLYPSPLSSVSPVHST